MLKFIARTVAVLSSSSLAGTRVMSASSSSSVSAASIHFEIHGFDDCSFYQRALDAGQRVADDHADVTISAVGGSREAFRARLPQLMSTVTGALDPAHASSYASHRTSPLVLQTARADGQVLFVGGCDNFLSLIRKRKW